MRSTRTALCIAFLSAVTVLHAGANITSAGLTAPTQNQQIVEWTPTTVMGNFGPDAAFVSILLIWEDPATNDTYLVLRDDWIFCDENGFFSTQIVPFRDPDELPGAKYTLYVFIYDNFEQRIDVEMVDLTFN